MTHWRKRNSVGLPNSGSKEGQSFIHPFEVGSNLLFLFVVLLPIAIVGGLCISYAVLAPELVQYEQRVEAQALRPR